jgi:predicted RNA-binding Zn ribbon-like protein
MVVRDTGTGYARLVRTWAITAAADPTPPELGGRLCLAVANSVLWRRSAQPRDLLPDYPALVGYLHDVGLLTGAERDGLSAAAAAHPVSARRAYTAAIDLREALFRTLSATAAGRAPAPADLRAVTALLRTGMAEIKLGASADGHLVAAWPRTADRLDWPLWEIAGSAAALLLPGGPTWLKQCPGDRCGWLFVDRSRSHSRRWCSSEMCGNRDRARRHYARRAERLPGPPGGR